MSDRIITVARFYKAIDAHLAHGALEAEGIRSMVAGENLPGMTVYNAIAEPSVHLQVLESDLARACEVLGLDAPGGITTPTQADPEAPPPRCPQCGANRTHSKGPSLIAGLLSVLMVLPFFNIHNPRDWHCPMCKHTWHGESSEDPTG